MSKWLPFFPAAPAGRPKSCSEKTLYSSRQRLIEKGLDQITFEQTSEKLAAVFGVDPEKQHLDSVHLRSNMRKLGRIAIFSQTILKFLVNLKRHHRDLFDGIDPEVTARYWGKKTQSASSVVKSSESGKTLKTVSADLFQLIERLQTSRRFAPCTATI